MAVVKAKLRVPGALANVAPTATTLIPANVQEFAAGFGDLIKAYYRWADLPGNFAGDSKRLQEYLDYNKSPDEIFAFIKQMFLRSLPTNSAADVRGLMKFAKDFYSTKGTEESYKFLFRALFNDDVQLEYPGAFLFETSNGIWTRRQSMKCFYSGENIEQVVGRRLFGLQSGASAIVKDFKTAASSDSVVLDLSLSNVVGSFMIDEIVETREGNKITSRVLGSIGQYTIVNAGLGYKENQIIPFTTPGDGFGLIIRIGAVGDRGEILSIEILDSGLDYSLAAPQLNMSLSTLFDANYTETAVATVELSISANYTVAGYYSKLKSAVSDIFKLQDGTYYQNFSYVLKTNVPAIDFRDIVTSTIHPAGTRMFTQTTVSVLPGDISNSPDSIFFHMSQPAAINYNSSGYESNRKFFSTDVFTFNAESLGSNYAEGFLTLIFYNQVNGSSLDFSESSYGISFELPVLSSHSSFAASADTLNINIGSSPLVADVGELLLGTLEPFLPFYGLSPIAISSTVVSVSDTVVI